MKPLKNEIKINVLIFVVFLEGIKPDGDDTETTEVRSEEVSINTVSDEVDADDDSDDGGKTNISFPCNMMVRYLKG